MQEAIFLNNFLDNIFMLMLLFARSRKISPDVIKQYGSKI